MGSAHSAAGMEKIMSYREFAIAVKKFEGWIEDGIAYFPSFYQKKQFERYCEVYKTR